MRRVSIQRCFNCDRLSLYLNRDKNLTQDKSVLISKIPSAGLTLTLQYILGHCGIHGFEFKVDSRALIPRPETEILVESAINRIKSLRY